MPFGALGLRRLLDANQRFTAAGLPFYLRIKNFVDNPIVEEQGFQYVPPTDSGQAVGTTDIKISPPPEIYLISLHNLAMAQAAGVALRAGARTVTISHTWVLARQRLMNYSTPQQVFNDTSVVGVVTDNLLLEIVNMVHDDSFGQIIQWRLSCNASELSGA